MQPDVEAILDIFRASSTAGSTTSWGFAYHDRIFGAPGPATLLDLDAAITELEWAFERGAGSSRCVRGRCSPRTAASCPPTRCSSVLARLAEARPVVACHPGFDDGYRDVENVVARSWGYESRRRQGAVSRELLRADRRRGDGHRLIHDFMVVVVAQGLFERHPGLRFASIENGVSVGARRGQKTLARLSYFVPDFERKPRRAVPRARVGDAVHRRRRPRTTGTHARRAGAVRLRLPARRGLRGAEAIPPPAQGVSAGDQQRIMRDNARDLMRR